MNVHGYVRATHDLDIFIRPTEESARSVLEALLAASVPVANLVVADFLDDEQNVRLGSGEDHIDILSSIGEMRFDQVWRNRVEAEVGGLLIPFISKSDLIANKRQVGRLRDLADVEELERIPEG